MNSLLWSTLSCLSTRIHAPSPELEFCVRLLVNQALLCPIASWIVPIVNCTDIWILVHFVCMFVCSCLRLWLKHVGCPIPMVNLLVQASKLMFPFYDWSQVVPTTGIIRWIHSLFVVNSCLSTSICARTWMFCRLLCFTTNKLVCTLSNFKLDSLAINCTDMHMIFGSICMYVYA